MLLLKREVWLPFLLSRLIYLAAACLTMLIKDNLLSPVVPWPTLSQLGSLIHRSLFFADSGWYESIVRNGYEARIFTADVQANWAFFPLYPFLVAVFGGSAQIGFILSNTSAILGLMILHDTLIRKTDLETANRTIMLLSFYPWSYHLSSYRTEGLFLLLTVATWAFAVKGRWWSAGFTGLLAALTRPQGILAAIIIGHEYLKHIDFRFRRARAESLSVAAPFLGTAIFSFYMWLLTTNPLAWINIQATWSHRLSSPHMALIEYLFQPTIIDWWGWNLAAFNWLLAVAALLTAVYMVMRHRPMAYYAAAGVVLPLIGGGTIGFGRYMTVMFPLHITWAQLVQHDDTYHAVLSLFAAFLALLGAWVGLGLHAALN